MNVWMWSISWEIWKVEAAIYERKPRQIVAAPFRDRVVHHALMNLVEAPIDCCFIDDSYACRKGKGVHRAVARYQGWAQQYRHALKFDISRYFPSIDHPLLKEKIARYIKDPQVLDLFARIIDTSPAYAFAPHYFPGDDLLTPLERRRGIPIGNLTSQFLANLFLNDFDHHLKSKLRLKAYLRYVDDCIVLSDDTGLLREVREIARERLLAERLVLHPRKAHRTGVARPGCARLPCVPGRAPRAQRQRSPLRAPPACLRPRLRGGTREPARLRAESAQLARPRAPRRYPGLARTPVFGHSFTPGIRPRDARVIRGGSWNNNPSRRTRAAWPAGIHDRVSLPPTEERKITVSGRRPRYR